MLSRKKIIPKRKQMRDNYRSSQSHTHMHRKLRRERIAEFLLDELLQPVWWQRSYSAALQLGAGSAKRVSKPVAGQFKALSALEEGKGKAANATQVAARAREDDVSAAAVRAEDAERAAAETERRARGARAAQRATVGGRAGGARWPTRRG